MGFKILLAFLVFAGGVSGQTAPVNNSLFFGMTNWVNGGPALDTQPYPALGAAGHELVKPGIIRSWNTYTGWADMAIARGKYNWSRLDTLLDKADSNGAQVLYVFGLIPDWAAGNASVSGCVRKKNCNPPSDLDVVGPCQGSMQGITTTDCQVKEFVRDLLGHAGKHVNPTTGRSTPIRYIELGNETNNQPEWRGSISQHVRLSRDIAQTAREREPSIFVISPGVNAVGNGTCQPKGEGSGVCWILEWLDQTTNHGAAFIDAIGFHGYVGAATSRGTITLKHDSKEVTLEASIWQRSTFIGGTLTVSGRFPSSIQDISPDGKRAMLTEGWAGPDWHGGYVLGAIRAEAISATVNNLRAAVATKGAPGKPLWDTENSWCGEACSFNAINIKDVTPHGSGAVFTAASPSAFLPGEEVRIRGSLLHRIFGQAELSLTSANPVGNGDNSFVVQDWQPPSDVAKRVARGPTDTWIAFPAARQSAYVARKLLIEFSLGVSANIWYAYSSAEWEGNPQYGTLCDLETPSARECLLRPAGEAWGEVFKWLAGVRPVGPCAAKDLVWTCDFVDQSGAHSRAVWNSSAAGEIVQYQAPAEFLQVRDLHGGIRNIPSSRSVDIGMSPVLLLSNSAIEER